LEDDAELEDIAQKYRSGEMLTGEMKARCIKELQSFVSAFQERREKVTYETMREFTRPRKMEYKGNPNPTQAKAAPLAETSAAGADAPAAREDGRGTKGERKAAKLAEKLAAKEKEKLALRQKAEAGQAQPAGQTESEQPAQTS
jgi:tryptophanyl-tRNA synthetase